MKDFECKNATASSRPVTDIVDSERQTSQTYMQQSFVPFVPSWHVID